jgi:hypothetical protein
VENFVVIDPLLVIKLLDYFLLFVLFGQIVDYLLIEPIMLCPFIHSYFVVVHLMAQEYYHLINIQQLVMHYPMQLLMPFYIDHVENPLTLTKLFELIIKLFIVLKIIQVFFMFY